MSSQLRGKVLVVGAMVFLVVGAPALAVNLLVNPGFEQGSLQAPPTGWTSVTLGPVNHHFERRTDASFNGTAAAAHINIEPPGLGDESYMYQQVTVQSGGQYTASIIRRLFTGGGEPKADHVFGVGVDPTGGTNWNGAAVVKTTVQATNQEWLTLSLGSPVMASGGTMTFFIYSRADLPAGNAAWWGHYFDDAVLDGPEPTGDTPTPTNTPTNTPLPGPDADGDGLPDSVEAPNDNLGPGKSNMLLPDSDSDGLIDSAEDANSNGARDFGETSARDADSDDDQYEDGLEVLILGTDPLNPGAPATAFADADGDDLPDPQDPNDGNKDTDDDGIDDMYDAAYFGSAAAANNAGQKPPMGDVNGDGNVANLDALIIQSLFLAIIDYTHPAFDQGPQHTNGFRYGDVTRDGVASNIDALVVQSFFLSMPSAPQLPLRF